VRRIGIVVGLIVPGRVGRRPMMRSDEGYDRR
jgi:hypothetical protein